MCRKLEIRHVAKIFTTSSGLDFDTRFNSSSRDTSRHTAGVICHGVLGVAARIDDDRADGAGVLSVRVGIRRYRSSYGRRKSLLV